MTLWALRQQIESNLPWWLPLAAVGISMVVGVILIRGNR